MALEAKKQGNGAPKPGGLGHVETAEPYDKLSLVLPVLTVFEIYSAAWVTTIGCDSSLSTSLTTSMFKYEDDSYNVLSPIQGQSGCSSASCRRLYCDAISAVISSARLADLK